MAANQQQNGGVSKSASRDGARRRSPWPLVVVAALFIIAPFLTWYGTWFGRSLSDEQIEKYLADEKSPRHAQHALSQIGEKISRREPGAERWYGRVAELARTSASPDVRMTAAWVMGGAHRSEEFRASLLRLLEDPEPIVRRNAALSLVGYNDARARTELLAMLRPYNVVSPTDGTAQTILSVGTPVKREAMLVRLDVGEGKFAEVRSPLPGRVEKVLTKQGDAVRAGDTLLALAPDTEQVRDALVGLSFVGMAEDLTEIERYRAGVEGFSDEIKEEAARASEAIKRRSAQNSDK
ncbi:MAG TPA: HEAT repeat domain-containing protein [Pyrinomonadaceae bacterium]|nr:HEAT repeat domain-containing protein [Pyrinomonadaceae bacterium]